MVSSRIRYRAVEARYRPDTSVKQLQPLLSDLSRLLGSSHRARQRLYPRVSIAGDAASLLVMSITSLPLSLSILHPSQPCPNLLLHSLTLAFVRGDSILAGRRIPASDFGTRISASIRSGRRRRIRSASSWIQHFPYRY